MTLSNQKQTEQDGKDTELILYRIDILERGQQRIETKIDKQDNIKRQDLKDFQETIVTRFLDMSNSLQKQIDTKASSSELKDLKKLFYSATGFLSTIIAALIIAYLTTRN